MLALLPVLLPCLPAACCSAVAAAKRDQPLPQDPLVLQEAMLLTLMESTPMPKDPIPKEDSTRTSSKEDRWVIPLLKAKWSMPSILRARLCTVDMNPKKCTDLSNLMEKLSIPATIKFWCLPIRKKSGLLLLLPMMSRSATPLLRMSMSTILHLKMSRSTIPHLRMLKSVTHLLRM